MRSSLQLFSSITQLKNNSRICQSVIKYNVLVPRHSLIYSVPVVMMRVYDLMVILFLYFNVLYFISLTNRDDDLNYKKNFATRICGEYIMT